IASEMGPPAVATVGTIAVEPAQVNVVPALARFTVDARHSDNTKRVALVSEIEKACKVIGRERELSVDVRTLRDRPPVSLHERTMVDGARPISGDLVISGSRISGVGQGAAAPQDAEVLERPGHYVMPGLVQTHVHLVQTIFRGLAEDLTLLDWLRRRVWPLEA